MSQRTIDLIGVGSPILDILAQVEDDFLMEHVSGAKGGMELVDSMAMGQMIGKIAGPLVQAPGGSAANSVVGAQRLGLRTSFLGKVGNDATAAFYEQGFQSLGTDVRRFKRAEVSNARCLSLVTPDSQRTMRTDLGAAMTMQPEEISPDDFEGCRHAHIEGYQLFNPALMQKILASAKAAGCTISLDLASFEVVRASGDSLKAILKNDVTVVFANEDEGEAFTGLKDDYEGMARALGELCEIAVVKMGKDGAWIANKGGLIRVQPVRVEHAVDTTGAGDLWAGGFLYGWLRGLPLEECGRIGSLLGSEVVQVMGAAIPEERWEVIRQMLKI